MPRPGGGTVKVAVKAVKSNLIDADRIISSVDRDDTPPPVVAAEVDSLSATEPASQPEVLSVGASTNPIAGDGAKPTTPPPDEPIVIDTAPKDPTALNTLKERKARRLALEAEVERRENERKEFYESRGATDIEPTKTGKTSRVYAPFGLNDRPSWAPQPVSEDDLEQGNIIVPKVQAPFKSPTPVSAIDERARYGLSPGGTNLRGETLDDLELPRGKMFAGGAPAPYRADVVGRSARLDEGIANIQRKVDKANTERNATQAKITEREHAMKLIDEIMPRKPDGSISNVGNVRPLSDEAKSLLQDYTDTVPDEEHSRINYAALMEDYDSMKAEADALRPELRRSKLRTAQLAMALSKYQDIYTNLPTDRSGS